MNRLSKSEAFVMWALRWFIALATVIAAFRILFLHRF
jgi:hypothetical protein